MSDFKSSSQKKNVPVCPNHGAVLEGIGKPIPSKGTGMCPVSGCWFDFEVETDNMETRVDKFGGVHKDINYNVTGEE